MRRVFVLLPGVALLLLAGCIRSDYVGREFEPLPESERIAWFKERTEIPVGEYRIIGRINLRAVDGTDGYDIREHLMTEARAKGADAVCLVRSRRVKTGLYEREDKVNLAPGAPRPLDPANVEFAEIRAQKDAEAHAELEKHYGKPIKLTGNEPSRTEVWVNALFLKKKDALEAELTLRDEEIESVSPAPVDPALRNAKPQPQVKAEE